MRTLAGHLTPYMGTRVYPAVVVRPNMALQRTVYATGDHRYGRLSYRLVIAEAAKAGIRVCTFH